MVGDRNVFFFVSGGVDSTVAYTLCLRALGPERVRGVYVDTGLMREGKPISCAPRSTRLGAGTVEIDSAQERFLAALDGVRDPEQKRHIIGEQFLQVQERIIESRGSARRPVDSGPGHHLSRYHRIRRNGKGRGHQDPSQPRRRRTEADCARAASSSRSRRSIRTKSARSAPSWASARTARSASVPGSWSGDSLPMRGSRSFAGCNAGRLPAPDPVGRRARRFTLLCPGPGDSRSAERRCMTAPLN